MKDNLTRLAPLLTPEVAAELLGLSRRTMYRWIADGRFPTVKLSARAVRIPEEAIARFIQERTVSTK